MGDDEDRPTVGVAADELAGEVGLPAEPVAVLAWLVGEAEAEEVEGEDGRPLQLAEQQPPVVGARREPVQEQEQRSLPVAAEDVDAVATVVLAGPAALPESDPVGALTTAPPLRPGRTVACGRATRSP